MTDRYSAKEDSTHIAVESPDGVVERIVVEQVGCPIDELETLSSGVDAGRVAGFEEPQLGLSIATTRSRFARMRRISLSRSPDDIQS